MGLSAHAFRLLLSHHKESPFEGPVLMLGRQRVYCGYEEMLGLFAEAGIVPVPLPPGVITGALPRVGGAGETNDVAFFAHLGLQTFAMDYSDFEGAEIIADLSKTLDERLHGQFGTVIDSGTIEHVFNLRQAFTNCVKLLRPGGQIVHISPVNNYVNHGFYQLNPTVFHDYYDANHFTDTVSHLIVHARTDIAARPWFIIPYDHEKFYSCSSFINDTNSQLAIFFRGRKTSQSSGDELPIQKLYREAYANNYRRYGSHVITYSDAKMDCTLQ
jgi:SAM-dependent methyltransferase